jgi:hypothetical protein
MKRALKILAGLSLLALALCLWACQSQKESSPSSPSQGLKIVTSFYPIYSMVKAISGDLNDVRMIQSSSGIHDFEPSANDVAAIYDADVFVYHSRTLESWAGELNPSLKNSKVQGVKSLRLPREWSWIESLAWKMSKREREWMRRRSMTPIPGWILRRPQRKLRLSLTNCRSWIATIGILIRPMLENFKKRPKN